MTLLMRTPRPESAPKSSLIVAKRGMFFVAALENVTLTDAAKYELIALARMIRAAQIDETKEDDHD